MWISHKKLKQLEAELHNARTERDVWQRRYQDETNYDRQFRLVELYKLKQKCEMLSQELTEWKQKYADEVQKRIALIERTKR